MASLKCVMVATRAADGRLSKQEILEAFDRIDGYQKKLEAEGKLTGKAERLRKWSESEAERTKIAAAMRKRHAALNVLVREQVDAHIQKLIDGDLKPHQALRALMEGINSPAEGSRLSIDAVRQSYAARYTGSLMADLSQDRPHLIGMLKDEKFDVDVTREMSELREGGKPGVTGNEDAKYLARKLSEYSELARTESNDLGASIGKLDGRTGVQTHDVNLMIQAGKDRWTARVATLIDVVRTFPEGILADDIIDVLGDIYDTIITGMGNDLTPAEMGQRVSPANLAKSLGKHRVLHMRDVEAEMVYREEFGYGNTISGAFVELNNFARVNALMKSLGPNPHVMFASVAEGLRRDIRNSTVIPDVDKPKLGAKLDTEHGQLLHAMDIATGMINRTENLTAAKLGSDIRSVQSMSKLGAAVVSSFADVPTAAAASQFRGSGFIKGLTNQLAGLMRGRPKAEQARISYMLGEGFDGLIGEITNKFHASDAPRGMMSGLLEQYFRWNGLTWWTDVNRSVVSRTVSAELGMWSGTPYKSLDPRFRNVLSQGGIDATTWDVLSKAALTMDNGKPYLTPDMIRLLPDDAVEPLVAKRLQAARERGGPDMQERIDKIMSGARRDLEIKMLAYGADQTTYGMVEPDARSRRWMTQGTRPGSLMGEIARYVMQFKGFPLSFSHRVIGRAMFAHAKDTPMLSKLNHIGSLMAGLTIAGYMSLVSKDILKGYWPPRDPTDWRTVMAAMQQGGAWGIYGDFLFSKVNRFGGGVTETMLGPTLGSAGDLIDIGLNARDAAFSGGEDTFSGARAFSTLQSSVPYANLHVLKPAMDYLFINSIREALSPGYMKRQATNRKREYGQTPVTEQLRVKPAADPLNITTSF